MGRVTVRRNDFPAIIRELPDAVDSAVKDEARDMATELAAAVWRLYGYVEGATVARTAERQNHAEVWCGYNRDHGFYSRFNEWGTVKQAARPIVGPTAHRHEPLFAKRMTGSVQEACRAR